MMWTARLTPQCLRHSLFRHSEATVAWGKAGGHIRSHRASRFWSRSAYSHPRSRKHPTKTQPAVSFRLHNNNHGERNCRAELVGETGATTIWGRPAPDVKRETPVQRSLCTSERRHYSYVACYMQTMLAATLGKGGPVVQAPFLNPLQVLLTDFRPSNGLLRAPLTEGEFYGE
jgi:hypothetical protein